MKTLLFAFCFLIGVSSFGQTPACDLISSRIQSSIHMPDHLKTPGVMEKVFVVFTIDENGKAHIVEMSKCTPETQASITAQFGTIDFSGTGHNTQQTYSIWLKFNMM